MPYCQSPKWPAWSLRTPPPRTPPRGLVLLVAEAVRAHAAGLGELERDPLHDDGEREHRQRLAGLALGKRTTFAPVTSTAAAIASVRSAVGPPPSSTTSVSCSSSATLGPWKNCSDGEPLGGDVGRLADLQRALLRGPARSALRRSARRAAAGRSISGPGRSRTAATALGDRVERAELRAERASRSARGAAARRCDWPCRRTTSSARPSRPRRRCRSLRCAPSRRPPSRARSSICIE